MEPSLASTNRDTKPSQSQFAQSVEEARRDLSDTGDGYIESKVITLGAFVDTDAVSFLLVSTFFWTRLIER